ncbi:unnamed protein product, partial [Effrenium voratum]
EPFSTEPKPVHLPCSGGGTLPATPEQRQQLERAVNRYQNLEVPPLPTRAAQNAGGGAAREAGEDARRNFRLRATGCMFTYNSADFQRIVWPEFLAWLGTLNFLLRWTATMEQSLRSSVEGRLHLHVFTEFQQAIDWTSLRSVLFRGVTPHASPCTARGPNVRDALNRGHFYVFANKQGTLGPLECKIRVGFSGRQRQVASVKAHECAAALQQKQQEIAGRLALLQRPFRSDVLAALGPWASQYAELKMRYKFLVLRGGSQTGKSTLAKSLGDTFGWKPPYVQTVQSAPAPDLKEFEREEHGYILFDNVNHMNFVLNEQALFQANNDLHTLGSSRTGIYAYSVWLFRTPLVVTVDLSAEWNSSELWLADNMFEVVLESPCYT